MVSREHICSCAFKQIAEKGIKRFSIDELSQHLHVSKRTIYILFQNKKDLLRTALSLYFGNIIERMRYVANNQPTPLEAMVYSILEVFNSFRPIPQEIMAEIINCKDVSDIAAQTFGEIKIVVKGEFEKAVEEGLFISGIESGIIGRLLHDQIISADYHNEKYTPSEVCFFSTVTILNGIITQKGKIVIEEILRRGVYG